MTLDLFAGSTRRVAVSLPVPLHDSFDYAVPDELPSLQVGHVVAVPFGRRTTAGVVVQVEPPAQEGLSYKPVRSLLYPDPVLTDEELRFLRWVARYYRHPLGQVIATALPPLIKGASRGADDPTAWKPPSVEVVRLNQGETATLSAFARPDPVRDRMIAYIARFDEVEIPQLVAQFSGARPILAKLRALDLVTVESRQRSAQVALDDAAGEDAAGAPELTDEQAEAVQRIGQALADGEFAPVLLHGVTGSGKTEVYLRAAEQVLGDGGGVLVLVPEIALTPQLVERFAARLGVPLAVLHSGLTASQRLQRWYGLRDGSVRLAIGARSAVFAPVADLKLIVVDEEHDGSYKQDDGLRYHARDVAMMRASQASAVCVVGSATPSLETLHNADAGRYQRLVLSRRVQDRPMPGVTVVDLREERGGDGESQRLLTPTLVEAVGETVERGEQVILLLNRRGLSTMVVCGGCGGQFRCEDCDTAMTYHGRRHLMICHYCSRAELLPERCPNCGTASIELLGEGTERVEEGLAELLPGLRVDRMDRDTTLDRGAHARILDRFRRGDIQVLVGTQMVAKGHDFPRVTLVGVLHADAALHMPDFRAGERTFALLTQVAGRAGRDELPGRVLVQTFAPHHEAIRHALQHDYEGYARRLLQHRQALGYPPFSRLAMVRLSHRRESKVRRAATVVGDAIRGALRARGGRDAGLRMLGPAPAPLQRLAGRHRWRVMLLAPDPRAVAAVFDQAAPALAEAAKIHGLRLAVDIDPQSML